MSEKGRGRSRGRGLSSGQQVKQKGTQPLPHAQLSSDSTRRPGQSMTRPGSSQVGGHGQISHVGGKGDSTTTQLSRGIEKLTIPMSGGGDVAAATARGAARGRRIIPQDIFIMKPTHITNKKGSSGSKIMLTSNYFKLLTTTDWCIYQYHVDFAPEEDRTRVRKGLLRLHKEKIGAYIFDGTVLYTGNRLPENMELLSTRESDNAHIRMTLRVVGSLQQGDHHYIQFFNIIMRKCLDHLQLQLVGRNYFDAHSKICLQEFRLELWPGYVTSIRQHEHSILMCAEITHKVMRQETLLDILKDCSRRDNSRIQDMFKAAAVGMVVLTDYNNNTYRIEDVDFKTTPQSKFPMRDGSMVSYLDYYKKKYGINIRERNQPMLLTRNKPKDRQADIGDPVFLVPELCRATGLTDTMRENFGLMKALSQQTRINPSIRVEKLMKFNRRLLGEPKVTTEFKQWNMELDENLLEFPARVLPLENIIFGGKVLDRYNNGDWSREMQNKKCLVACELQNWIFIASERDSRSTQNFVDCLIKVSRGISFPLVQPKMYTIRDDRASSYSEFLEQILSKQSPQLVFCVVSNNRVDRYSAIKKKCCIDRPVPSQVYLQRNLGHRNILSIATKVAIQMNCKLGGAPWSVHIPLNGLMVVGFDVCHDTLYPGKDVGAMVASLNNALTKYFSTADMHQDGDELSAEFSSNICKAAMSYRAHNNVLPTYITIYRDGVGEGQVSHVIEHEIAGLRMKLNELYGGENYKMLFIIVTKRLNTRFFYNKQNPPAGTVVDDFVTSPIKYDFFIVSQQVRDGTITPTAYNVVYDNLGLTPDQVQRLTYKLTHMYFNCSNTVRVPAPCHYAHKLAFMISKYIHRLPQSQLQNTLYFL